MYFPLDKLFLIGIRFLRFFLGTLRGVVVLSSYLVLLVEFGKPSLVNLSLFVKFCRNLAAKENFHCLISIFDQPCSVQIFSNLLINLLTIF